MAAPHFSTATANFGPNVLTPAYLQTVFQDPLHARLLTYELGKIADLPENMGKTVRWNKMANPAAATTSLAEDDPSTTTLTTVTVTATLADYGTKYVYSKFLELTALKQTIQQISSQAGYEAALTTDTLNFTQALTDATQVDAGVAMTAETVKTVCQTLQGLNCPPHPATPGEAFLAGIFSPEQCYDMMSEGAPTWMQIKRQELAAAMRLPWRSQDATGAVYDAVIRMTTVVTSQSASSEEFGYIMGAGAFGVVSLGAGNPMSPTITLTPPSARVDRANRDQGTLGWLLFYVSELINGSCIREIKSDVT
jgi:N4-gp56 family major capsid protein